MGVSTPGVNLVSQVGFDILRVVFHLCLVQLIDIR